MVYRYDLNMRNAKSLVIEKTIFETTNNVNKQKYLIIILNNF